MLMPSIVDPSATVDVFATGFVEILGSAGRGAFFAGAAFFAAGFSSGMVMPGMFICAVAAAGWAAAAESAITLVAIETYLITISESGAPRGTAPRNN